MTTWYMRGTVNYDHHDDARAAFERRREGVVALRLCEDGAAYIAELTDRPLQPGQCPFNVRRCILKIDGVLQ